MEASAGGSPWQGILRTDGAGHFQQEGGEHFFLQGYECDWLWALAQKDLPATEKFLRGLKAYGFNCIHMNLFAYDTAWRKGTTCASDYGPPECIPWAGTPENPDHGQLNPVFFEKYDQVMELLHGLGFAVHLYFKVYNKFVVWPARDSAEEALLFAHVIARYQAYPGVIWDLSKECYLEPDKDYILRQYRNIRALDGYRHLTTLHDEPDFYQEHVRDGVLDFFTAQQFYDFYYHTLYYRQALHMPVLNAEFGYDRGTGESATYTQSHDSAEVIHRAWEITMAGGYTTYYDLMTAWDVIDVASVPAGCTGMKILREVMTALPWWKLTRCERVCCWRNMRCLGIPGELYLVYVHGIQGKIMMQLGPQADAFQGQWINPFTGQRCAAELTCQGTYVHSQMPSDMPQGVLLLTPKDKGAEK